MVKWNVFSVVLVMAKKYRSNKRWAEREIGSTPPVAEFRTPRMTHIVHVPGAKRGYDGEQVCSQLGSGITSFPNGESGKSLLGLAGIADHGKRTECHVLIYRPLHVGGDVNTKILNGPISGTHSTLPPVRIYPSHSRIAFPFGVGTLPFPLYSCRPPPPNHHTTRGVPLWGPSW